MVRLSYMVSIMYKLPVSLPHFLSFCLSICFMKWSRYKNVFHARILYIWSVEWPSNRYVYEGTNYLDLFAVLSILPRKK